MKLHILKNPDLQEILLTLRDSETRTTDFRRNLRYAGYLMTHEIISRELYTTKVHVKTPLGTAEGEKLEEKILQIIVMRAGEPFADGGARLLDEINAKREIGIVDAKRIEKPDAGKNFEIQISSFKVPAFDKKSYLIIYDPMIGSACTLTEIIRRIKKQGEPKKIIMCSILSCTYAVNKLKRTFPELTLYTLAVDKKLNENGYIVPGLGDCGDRAFGTY